MVKKDGIVAAREANHKSFAWCPEPPEITRWTGLYQEMACVNGRESNSGRYYHVWARKAGFKPDDIEATWDTRKYAGGRATHLAWNWRGRILQPGFIDSAVSNELRPKKRYRRYPKHGRCGEMVRIDLLLSPVSSLFAAKLDAYKSRPKTCHHQHLH